MRRFAALAPSAQGMLGETARGAPPFARLLSMAAHTTPGLDPMQARALFVRDLDRSVARGVRGDAERDVVRSAERERARAELESGRHGYGYRTPEGKQRTAAALRTAPEMDYMVRAIMRDNALAGYDRAMEEHERARRD